MTIILNTSTIEDLFKKTFDTIFRCWGDNALKFKTSPGTGKFSVSFFETVALGIAQNIQSLPTDKEIKKIIDGIGRNARFRAASGSGKNASRRIPELVKLGKQLFEPK
ncbi:hypothetical protein LGR54_02255 [Ancylobacter sp. Lp-2]|uniref:hypothetical protein n=1 Tax=Ancylobacter sp. Lp-2 TaxID=2881339 RepID=UPI001E423CD2|nr:hypothetical protein [Ancylobacter sp. Lp-2]MCB4767415.1 hypothetical protein [Ancylobacter sp. Lp-2]